MSSVNWQLLLELNVDTGWTRHVHTLYIRWGYGWSAISCTMPLVGRIQALKFRPLGWLDYCTPFLFPFPFKGKSTEAVRDKEVKMAKENGCFIISPHWINVVSSLLCVYTCNCTGLYKWAYHCSLHCCNCDITAVFRARFKSSWSGLSTHLQPKHGLGEYPCCKTYTVEPP